MGTEPSGHNQPAQIENAATTQIEHRDIVPVEAPVRGTMGRSSSTRRWRTHVPFIAQYIGQETAIETSERASRRHNEFARKAYEKRTSLSPSPRTIAHI